MAAVLDRLSDSLKYSFGPILAVRMWSGCVEKPPNRNRVKFPMPCHQHASDVILEMLNLDLKREKKKD